MISIKSPFQNAKSQKIDHFFASHTTLAALFPRDLVLLILDYQTASPEDREVSGVALYILKKADWNYRSLSNRKKFYLEWCNLRRLAVPSLLYAGDRRPRPPIRGRGWVGSDTEPDSDEEVPLIPVERIMRTVCLFASRLTELEVGDVKGWGCEHYEADAFEMTVHRSADQVRAYGREIKKVCEAFKQLKKLRKLHVYGYRLNDEMTAQVIDSCPELTDLKFTRASNVTDQTLKKLSEAPHLTSLYISSDHRQFTGEGLNCPQLTYLFLGRARSHQNWVTEFPLKNLIARHPKLQQLHIDGFRLDSKQMDLVKGLAGLKHLCVGDYDRNLELARAVAAIRNASYESYFIRGDFD